MTVRGEHGIILLVLVVIAVAGYAIWLQTQSVRIQKLSADIPGGRTEQNPRAEAALSEISALAPEAIPVLMKQLDSTDCPDGLVQAFVKIGPEAAPALLEHLVRARNPRLISSAALAKMEGLGAEHLGKLLDLGRFDSDSLIRSRCITAAAKINPLATAERCRAQLEADLRSTQLTRVHAAIALDAIGPVNKQMAELIKKAKQDPRLTPFMHNTCQHN